MDAHEGLGDIKINNEVITMIASLAAVEVDGIVSLAGKYSLAEMWGRKDMDKGITVEINKDNSATVAVEVNVEYGIDIYRAARQLQLSVKNAIESMTGIHVKAINVTIRGAVLGDQPRRPSVAQGPEIQSIAGGQ
ncbi:Asp23/Gls24 family envelope stress response protein [Candidatus Sumerlaeota bacterium]|nr:Asp23/Gls24 family envelope stress response protein [Candidatus Sumerlaeota bacterium]